MMKNDNDLFFTCSLIEYIGRECKLKRGDVVDSLGTKTIARIYKYAATLHCEPMEKVANDYIQMNHIVSGKFDNISSCRYEVPDYWTIGEVYERLIEDVAEGHTIDTLLIVYKSWINDAISNYNSDFYYQPRDYIAECFRQEKIL
ncbi:hypothetical protein [Hespellia stercorisuis]|uniref:Uncharacterized protein n=1 Tax=Hespellia stercorisuis DSM 15480 TaxID=1121950 RepID=A0A1M6WZC5_9FIRM|nr:hypothetical protein [Hespellia stercorisuis]SHK98925.1 hypothetical protein SAMN02745243_04130 [Hespellia stercorisuis DSM 15480]